MISNLIIAILIFGIALINVPLAVIIGLYFTIRYLFTVNQKAFDTGIFVVVLLVSLFKFSLNALMPTKYTTIVMLHSNTLYETIKLQFYNITDIYQSGMLILCLFPLLIQMITSWRSSSKYQNQNPKQAFPSKNPPSEEIKLGYDNNNHPVRLSDKELNQHCLIVGTTGSGKTTTLLNFVVNAAKRHLPLIFLDGKGSGDLIDKMRAISNQYNRTFKVFTLRPYDSLTNLAGYNPFGSGTATEWKNRIMSLFAQVEGKGQEHFALAEQNYINFVANVLASFNTKIDLRVILSFLENPDKLIAIAHEANPDMGKKLAKLHADGQVNELIGDVIKLLELFIYSDYGYLFNTTKLDNVINIRDSILNDEIILFQFDASSYPDDTNKVAKMVISDINSSFASFNKFTKCFCIFDEFASYASSNLAESISLNRSNGMHAIIGSQSMTTVKLKASDTKRIAEELIACCNTYIAQTINHFADAEIMAKIMGVAKNYEVTTTLTTNNDNQHSSQNIRLADSFKVHPQNIIDLKTGEAIIYRKAMGINPIKVNISQPDIT